MESLRKLSKLENKTNSKATVRVDACSEEFLF